MASVERCSCRKFAIDPCCPRHGIGSRRYIANLAGLVCVVVLGVLAIFTAPANSARHLDPAKLRAAFLCIHRHEGAWNSNTGNGYFGGLQMDVDFERAYGQPFLEMWGHAHRWPAYVQLAVAMRAYKVRGFAPWPNTRRMCGV